MRRAVRVLLAVVIVAAVLFLFVFPVRTLIDQRNQTGLAERRVKVLSAENAQLARQAKQLQTDSEIEQIARQRFGLILPGDHAYTVLPPTQGAVASTTTTTVGSNGSAPRGG
jgi:cell division protein FtsL